MSGGHISILRVLEVLITIKTAIRAVASSINWVVSICKNFCRQLTLKEVVVAADTRENNRSYALLMEIFRLSKILL
ncbi:MAG: hypothetical protein M3311_05750 [Thermoproteota archaeon]|nr:hypothetical protein [Thermoproteota archaeon]